MVTLGLSIILNKLLSYYG